jgi:serine/threonine protein kinase
MPNTIGDYEVYEELGHGGAATVYRALDTHTGQIVALKVLRPRETDDPKQLQQRLGVEARIANQLDHKNIVRVFEHGRYGDSLYIAMEYVNGETLARRLRREFQLTEAETHRIALEVAAALDAAFQHNVVHRDIKPGNILLGRSGEVKVADFGIARAIGARTQTQHGAVAGTLVYMAPELWDRDVDNIRVDLYALGIVMYEMLTGISPFDAKSEAQIVRKKLSEQLDFRPLRRASEKLAPVVERLLRHKPEERYPTPAALVQALEALSDLDTTHVPDLTVALPSRIRTTTGRGFSTVSRFTSRYQLPLSAVLSVVGIGLVILAISGALGGDGGDDSAAEGLVPPPVDGAAYFSTGSALPKAGRWEVFQPKRDASGAVIRVQPEVDDGDPMPPIEQWYPELDTSLGDAQVVCLSRTVPLNCPPGAFSYDRGQPGGWEIPDAIRADAQWIWAPRITLDDPADGVTYAFRTFVAAPRKVSRVSLAIAADNHADVFIGGDYWFSTTGPNTVTFFDIHGALSENLNTDVEILVLVQNEPYSTSNCREEDAPCPYRRNQAGFMLQGPREWVWDEAEAQQ